MARKVKRPKGPPSYEAKYYGPSYNSRADNRSPDRTTYDGPPTRPRSTGVPKGGKAKTVMRDSDSAYYYGKRARRS